MSHDPHADDDRKWSVWAGAAVAGALSFSMVVGLVVIPLAQAPNAGLDPWSAICRAIGIRPGTPAQPQPPVSATADPVSQVEWSPRTLQILAGADPSVGAALAEETCAACHGTDGLSVNDDYPRLAGQSAAAIYKQLSDYRSGARSHDQMTPVAQQLTAEQLAQVAAYFGNHGAGSRLGAAYEVNRGDDDIQRLANRGDPARKIAPCESCHANGVGGPIEAPVLRGQNAGYLERQLKAYKAGERRNDVYRRMRDIAGKLSDDEIRRLSQAYAGIY